MIFFQHPLLCRKHIPISLIDRARSSLPAFREHPCSMTVSWQNLAQHLTIAAFYGTIDAYRSERNEVFMSRKENEDVYFDADLISLLDDEGNEYEFEVLDEIDHRDGHFMVLMPLFDLPEEDISSENTYVILESVEDENGEPQLAELDDSILMEEIDEIYRLKHYGIENNL